MSSITNVFCTKCGRRIRLEEGNFRSSYDFGMVKRYHCLPRCPEEDPEILHLNNVAKNAREVH
mgnify:CR=1 FL=1